jgi:predicted nuclease of predicted toxin-antitoxin system
VRLLFDENLSRKLVIRLAELYPDSAHVAEAGLLQSPDPERLLRREAIRITEFAADRELAVLVLDRD